MSCGNPPFPKTGQPFKASRIVWTGLLSTHGPEASRHGRNKTYPGKDCGPRSQGAQPEEHRRGHPPQLHRGHSRRVRFRQVFPCPGRPLRRGLKALPGLPFHLHAAPHDPGSQGGRGRGALHPCSPCPEAKARRAWHTLHLRHRQRTSEQPAPHVLPPCLAPLPKRPLRAPKPCRGCRAKACLPHLRCQFLRSRRRGSGLQQPGCLPSLLGHRPCPHRGQGKPCAGHEPHH